MSTVETPVTETESAATGIPATPSRAPLSQEELTRVASLAFRAIAILVRKRAWGRLALTLALAVGPTALSALEGTDGASDGCNAPTGQVTAPAASE